MFSTYILHSKRCDRFYIGYCENLQARLLRHNNGQVTATRNCRPYEIVGFKQFPTEIEARREELRIKKQKSRKYIEWLIGGNW